MTNNIFKPLFGAAAFAILTTGCVDEFEPQSSTVTADQVSSAPGAYDNFVSSLTATLAGEFCYSPSSQYPFDFGFPSFFLIRDVMGHDIATRSSWFSSWYEADGYAPTTAICQYPWTCYYSWIKSCNTVISLAKTDLQEEKLDGLGRAYAIRAMLYMDLAQMYGMRSYAYDKECLTVPIVTDETSGDQLANNPNATNEQIWAFILSDLDEAEKYIDQSKTNDVYTPGLAFVQGLKARAYLIVNDWANAEKYAKLAQEGYSPMSADEYTNWETGFNTPNGAWIFGLQFNAEDPCILENDGDTSWGSQMFIEINPETSGCGYAANYGQPHAIDRHLYETIPATDARKKCYISFKIDDMSGAEAEEALLSYTKHPTWIENCAAKTDAGTVGGLELKFRTAGGDNGRDNQKIGFVCSVPVMRVEEMMLIEAEAAAWQDEARGKALLEAFAKTRDENFVYGNHNESYGNSSTPAIINEIWWQRRVELWGEGFATYDIKRLNKSVIRSYAGTNHNDGYQWNTDGPAPWMSLCIVQTETNYNPACISNPTPSAPSDNSAPYTF